jgi:hypothetical protein
MIEQAPASRRYLAYASYAPDVLALFVSLLLFLDVPVRVEHKP